mmetsp:Transcript_15222/g.26961  ORF Transcript_15222/g.26961 Transcript_15222/m.26961 type:complete len:223 (+) Transcript_15222:134-802(+)
MSAVATNSRNSSKSMSFEPSVSADSKRDWNFCSLSFSPMENRPILSSLMESTSSRFVSIKKKARRASSTNFSPLSTPHLKALTLCLGLTFSEYAIWSVRTRWVSYNVYKSYRKCAMMGTVNSPVMTYRRAKLKPVTNCRPNSVRVSNVTSAERPPARFMCPSANNSEERMTPSGSPSRRLAAKPLSTAHPAMAARTPPRKMISSTTPVRAQRKMDTTSARTG